MAMVMTRADEIRGAEADELFALRAYYSANRTGVNYTPVLAAQRRLENLQRDWSPLPTREEMVERHAIFVARFGGLTGGRLAEQHWADCLRWLAEHARDEFDVIERHRSPEQAVMFLINKVEDFRDELVLKRKHD